MISYKLGFVLFPFSTIVFLAILLFNVRTFANYSAELFEKNENRKNWIFKLDVKETSEQNTTSIQAQYTDKENNILVDERAKLSGDDLIKFEVTQKQLEQQALIEVQGEKVLFSKTEKGKTKTSQESKPKYLVVSSNFQKFVRAHWAELIKGEKIDIRFAVWDRMETVGFTLFKSKVEMINYQNTNIPSIWITMKPTSFIIAALVSPLIFKFKEDGTQLLEMIGRVPPKIKSGSSWKDFDAEVIYKL